MAQRIALATVFFFITCLASAQQASSDRQLWLSYMDKVARSVLSNLANDELKKNMPVELSKITDNATGRTAACYLEALGRDS